MTEKEAIQMLERIIDPDPWEDYGLSDKAKEALEMEIEALEKQIPRKPIEPEALFYKCPICKNYVGDYSVYCTVCGYKLDWSEDET